MLEDLATELQADAAVVDGGRYQCYPDYQQTCRIQQLLHVHSTNLISLPVRPPTLLAILDTRAAALPTADPAELSTRVRPSWAFDTTFETDSFALDAVSLTLSAALDAVSLALLAASDVVDALRKRVCRRNGRDCRSTTRVHAVAADMLMEDRTGLRYELTSSRLCAG